MSAPAGLTSTRSTRLRTIRACSAGNNSSHNGSSCSSASRVSASVTYTAQYRQQGREVHVRRHLVVARDVVAPADYPALEALLQAPIADARAVIVLRRGEE